jgi:hypothetical protein
MTLPQLAPILSPQDVAERDDNFFSFGQSYIIQNFVLDKINSSKNIYSSYITRYCFNNKDNIKEIINGLFTENTWQFIECSDSKIVILNETTCFLYRYDVNEVDYEVISPIDCYITGVNKEHVDNVKSRLKTVFSDKMSPCVYIKWVFKTQMGTSSYNSHLEMKKEPFNEMYPFLEGEDLQAYYERFRDSESSILLLQGPPGTGKTTFIRGLLSHLQENSIFTTDPEVFHNEGFLIDFMKGRENYLIFEDADAYLSSRENGNKTLHKFLTIGDGLVSRKKKKIIFTTNLQTLTDIDSALTRPGRCNDILQFRPLTINECREIIVAKNFNNNIPTKATTIAELFNTQEKTQIKKKQSIGFV